MSATWTPGQDADRREQWTLRLADGHSYSATVHVSDDGAHGRWRLQAFTTSGAAMAGGWYTSLDAAKAAAEQMENRR
jgi:hypothetical protein